MGLLDIFTFKRESTKIFSKENIENLIEVAKDAIIEQAKKKIKGEEKKKAVDAFVLAELEALHDETDNKLVLSLLERVAYAVPMINQKIYELLKAKIDEL